MSIKTWDEFIRELEMPEIESLKKEELEELVYQYENALSKIANIDTVFLNEEGECHYTHEEALEKIMDIVMPLWVSTRKRKK